MIIEYSKDIVEPPRYLDIPYFEEIVENAIRKANFKIKKVCFTMGSNTGDNYSSLIYRVKIQYALDKSPANETLSVIIKSMPKTIGSEFLAELQIFLKERIVFNDLLPRMELFLNGEQKFSARLYHSMKCPVNTLVFEDLAVKKFEMASRENGLDETHCRIVLQRLAQFHATSMVIGEKDPQIMECFQYGMLKQSILEDENSLAIQFYRSNAEALLEVVSTWPGYEKIHAKIKIYVDNLIENLKLCQKPVPNEIKVLNHGDIWVNNILFKYDEKRNVEDVTFVDFPMSIWSSPGIDLNYFLYTSLQLNILKHKREELIKVYYESLIHTLHNLNHKKVPTFQEICEEIRRREPYGFFANVTIFPLICMDKKLSSDSKLDNFADKDFLQNKTKQMYSGKKLQESMRYTMKRFYDLGIFD